MGLRAAKLAISMQNVQRVIIGANLQIHAQSLLFPFQGLMSVTSDHYIEPAHRSIVQWTGLARSYLLAMRRLRCVAISVRNGWLHLPNNGPDLIMLAGQHLQP